MALTMWRNTASGDRLDRTELAQFQARAQLLYRSNPHIFEDERDALVALGVVPIAAALDGLDTAAAPATAPGCRSLPCHLTTSIVRFLGGSVT